MNIEKMNMYNYTYSQKQFILKKQQGFIKARMELGDSQEAAEDKFNNFVK